MPFGDVPNLPNTSEVRQAVDAADDVQDSISDAIRRREEIQDNLDQATQEHADRMRQTSQEK